MMGKFKDLLNSLSAEKGQGALADEIGVDPAVLSRFRSGIGAIHIDAIEKLFAVGGAVVVKKEELDDLYDTIETLSELWKKERKNRTAFGGPE